MIEIYKDFCSGCRVCEKICPKNAIEMKEDERGFFYPIVNYDKCVKCGICRKKCPINNEEIEKEITAYAAYNKDEEIRLKSSSGGIFTIFANYVLENNGVVIGAALDDEFLVEHIVVENKKDLEKLRSSKYVQSNIKDSYEKTKEFLEEGRLVYFSGTPCQIEGLKAYLPKEYKNLITQDIICHGVPSPKAWKGYLKHKHNQNIKSIHFRNKEKGSWGDYHLKFEYENGKKYIHHKDDFFMKLFLGDLILRESCYQCKFKKVNRVSDFTLADFWGINNIDKSMNDEKGTSLLLVNSNKARDIIEEVSEFMIKKEVEFKEAIQFNLSMIKSVKKGKKFEKISKLLEKDDFEELFKEETICE